MSKTGSKTGSKPGGKTGSRAGKDRGRRERVEQLRREAQAAERRRTLVVVVACAVVATLIVGAAAWSYIRGRQAADQYAGAALADIGVSSAAAGCSPRESHQASGNQQHEPVGTPISYAQAPPEYGPHWPAPATYTRHFYADDRPPLEQLVHNLEHGYTILWYDDSIAKDSDAVAQLKGIAGTFDGDVNGDPTRFKFIVAPYTSDDPGSFPEGKHVALTHWAATYGSGGLPTNQLGIAQYCAKVSGDIVAQFTHDYPYTSSPEPGAV